MTKFHWQDLRSFTGAGPLWPVFPTKRRDLSEMKPGEKLLLVRKVGGLGDMLATTMLFPDLFEQYPEIEVTYAVPRQYFPLFEGHGTKLKLMDSLNVYGPMTDNTGTYHGPESKYHKSWVRKELLKEFQLIEDISRPCVVWETMMRAGIPGLKWRNRLDRWARWIGVTIKNPHSIIRLTDEEVQSAKNRMATTGKPVAVWSPVSALRSRSYPWYREIKSLLDAEGFETWLLHDKKLGPNSLTGLSLRQMGAAVAAADFVLSVDTATFHWAGILGKPTLGLFNLLLGESHAQYYEKARTLQLCDTPCLNERYDIRHKVACTKWYDGKAPKAPWGETLSKCFYPNSVGVILDTVRDMWPEKRTWRCTGS